MDLKKINMGKICDFSRNSPILFSYGFTLLVVLLNQTFSSLLYLLLPHTLWMDILYQVLFILWPAALVLIFGFGFIFRQRGIRATIGAALPLFLVFGYFLYAKLAATVKNPGLQWKSELEIFFGVLLLFGVGFREEVLYRGVITNAIASKYTNSPKGLWITVLSAGAMFGIMHLGNMFQGVSFAGALFQSISALVGGLLLCAVYLRGGNIWVMILLHSLIDTAPLVDMLFTNGTAGDLAGLVSDYSLGPLQIMFLVFELLLAVFLLRKSKRQKIFDRIQQMKSSEMAKF